MEIYKLKETWAVQIWPCQSKTSLAYVQTLTFYYTRCIAAKRVTS